MPKRFQTLAALCSAAVLSLVLTGCGEDERLTAAEFRAQAEELCEAAEEATDKIGEKLTSESTEEQVIEALDQLVDRTEELVDDLEDLDPPEKLEPAVDDLLTSVTAALEKLDDATAEDLQAMTDPFIEANQKAKELQLDACAK